MSDRIRYTLVSLCILVVMLGIQSVMHMGGGPGNYGLDADFNRMRFESPAGSLVFNRQGKDWTVGEQGYAAAPVVARLEKAIRTLKIIDTVSKKAYYKPYGLEKKEALQVSLYKDTKKVRGIMIGAKSATGKHTYVRIDDGAAVLLAAGIEPQDFMHPLQYYRNKQIARIAPDAVKEISITYGGKTFTLVREKEKVSGRSPGKAPGQSGFVWICREYPAVKLNQNRVAGLVRAFDPLRAKGFPELEKSSLKQAGLRVVLKTGKDALQFSFFNKQDKTAWIATASSSPHVFTVNVWVVDKLQISTIADLKAR